MNRLFVGFATAALVSGGLVAAGPGAGTAQAIDDCSPAAMVGAICYGPNHWCPGDSLLYLTQNHVYNPVTWDMTVCHNYHYSVLGGPGDLIPPPAGFCPPAPFSDNLYDPC